MRYLATASLVLFSIFVVACGHGGTGDCGTGVVPGPSDDGDGGVYNIAHDADLDDATCVKACGDALPCLRAVRDPRDEIWCTRMGDVCAL